MEDERAGTEDGRGTSELEAWHWTKDTAKMTSWIEKAVKYLLRKFAP